MKEFKINIDKGGNFAVDTKGFAAGACKRAVTELAMCMKGSKVVDEKDKAPDPVNLEQMLHI